jgi:putative ABC transport system ATP-binding protein
MEQNSIIIENLRREFQVGSETVRALRGVSFNVGIGEFVTIMGSSGSGKTTMLNILGCLDKPTGGSYMLDGIPVASLTKNELAGIRNQKIGFVFQSFNLLPRTSALENVELPLMYNSKVSAKERHERAMEALKAVGLADRFNHKPNQLSGGQQQRVAIARALVNDPVMILADEATGNLDTRTSYEILALFQKLNQSGKTIVFVTHEMDIATFSSRTITLKDGRLIKDAAIENRQWAQSILSNLPLTDEN